MKQWIHAGILAVIGVAAIFLFLHTSKDVDAADFVTNGRAEVATAHKLLERDREHQTAAAAARRRLSDSLGRVQWWLGETKRRADSLVADSQPKAALPLFVQGTAVCVDALTLCRTRGDSLFRADSAHSDSLARGLQRATSTIAQGIKVADCRWGPFHVFHCWSRGKAFKVGIVGGVTVTELVKKLLTGHF